MIHISDIQVLRAAYQESQDDKTIASPISGDLFILAQEYIYFLLMIWVVTPTAQYPIYFHATLDLVQNAVKAQTHGASFGDGEMCR